MDQGLSTTFILDRNKKFISNFWKAIFKRLGTRFLTSSIYYSQINGQLERINQTVEIALRFQFISNLEEDQVIYLLILRDILNNLLNASIGLYPNKVIYSYRLRDTLSSLIIEDLEDYVIKRIINVRDAKEAITWVNLRYKIIYNSYYRPITLNKGEEVFLKLY